MVLRVERAGQRPLSDQRRPRRIALAPAAEPPLVELAVKIDGEAEVLEPQMEVARGGSHGAISVQQEVGLERLRFVLQYAVEQARSAVRVEELLRTRLRVIPAKVIGERQEEGVDGEGRDKLVEVPGGVRFRVGEPREIKSGGVT